MQYGFVIDHRKCIGCHACTVACKSENNVPLGDFRTWVKYTEEGAFPEVKRSFAVLRCNQCSDAPCITICPADALSGHDASLKACLDYRLTSDSRCKDRCFSRLACPVAAEHKYSMAQLNYHYLRSMQTIEAHFSNQPKKES